MKHEYHYTVSRTDRIWLIVFVSVLLGWELVKPVLPSPDRALLKIEMPFIPDSIARNGYSQSRESEYHDTYQKRYYPNKSYPSYSNESQAQKRPINIMEATWQDLRAIGFQPKVASNIERYLKAGGKIQNANQLMKIYGMDSLQWIAVAPYVIFPESKNEITSTHSNKNGNFDEKRKRLDINKASAAELETLPGIGTVLAERILKYRNSLGGFITANQIGECYGMPPETLEKILPGLQVVESPTSISINKIDLKNYSHPYLSRKMARVVEAYRTQHGPFTGPADLRKSFPADTNWCDKLLPYLVFE